MRRLRKIALWVLAFLLAVPVLAVAALLIGLNIGPGRVAAEQLVGRLTGGQVVLAGLHGRFPDRLQLAHLEVRDAQGAWLLADNVALDWSPLALVHRTASVDLLTAARGQVPRLPVAAPAPTTPAAESKPFTLPVHVVARQIKVDHVEIGAPVAGTAAALSLEAARTCRRCRPAAPASGCSGWTVAAPMQQRRALTRPASA